MRIPRLPTPTIPMDVGIAERDQSHRKIAGMPAIYAPREGDDRPIITFAWSINRWHARNLAMRLVALGYTNVHWYRGGWEAWDAHDLPMAPLNVQFLPSR